MEQTVTQGTAINYTDIDDQSWDSGEYNNWSENELREELKRHGERASKHCDRNELINKLIRCGSKNRSVTNTTNMKSSHKTSDNKSTQQGKYHNLTESQLRIELKKFGETVKDNCDRSEMIRKLNNYEKDSNDSLNNQIPPQSVNKSIKKEEIQFGTLNRDQQDSQLVHNEPRQNDQIQGKKSSASAQYDSDNQGKDYQTKLDDNKLGQDTQKGQQDYQSNQQNRQSVNQGIQSNQQDRQSGQQDTQSNQKKSQSSQKENEEQFGKQDFKSGMHQTQLEKQFEQFGGLESQPSDKDQQTEKQHEISKRRDNTGQQMSMGRKQDGNHGKHDT